MIVPGGSSRVKASLRPGLHHVWARVFQGGPRPARNYVKEHAAFAKMTGAGACANTPGVADPVRRTDVSNRTCSVEGCIRLAASRGWCGMHYMRWLVHGDPGEVASTRLPFYGLDPFRVITKIVVDGNGCWIWRGAKDRQGYGKVGGTSSGRKFTVGAHRFSFTIFVGPIPEGLQLDHLCRVPLCVNPSHLEPVTGRTNVLRGNTFAAENAAKTHCIHGHPFDEQNTRVKNGRRTCRECHRASCRRTNP